MTGAREFNTSRFLLVCGVGIILLAIAARLLPGPRTIDDSFITFRYARNILAGNGFVYNPGERVLGTTTPLYTVLLTVLGSFTGGESAPFPVLAFIVNALADGVTCLLLFDLGRRLGSPLAGLGAALAWAVAPFSVTFAVGGLETSLYVLLLTATASAHLHKRRLPAALFGALAFLTRPDALIFLGPFVLDRLFQFTKGIREKGNKGESLEITKKFPIPNSLSLFKEAAIFLAPVLCWLAFSTVYFGSPLPHSITAKALAYHLPRSAAFVRLLQHYATPFLEHLTFGVPAIAGGLILYPFLSIVGARRSLRQDPHSWPLLIYPWMYFATFAFANPLIFRWYLTPPLPAYFLGIFIGLETFIVSAIETISSLRNRVANPMDSTPSRFPRPGGARRWGKPLLILLIFLIPITLSLRDWALHPDHGLERPAPEMAWYQLELLYHQAADLLAPELGHDPANHVLAAGDVGVLGFFTGARILDTVGLNSPVSTRYYPLDPKMYTINYAVPPDLILEQGPDFVVILEVYGREGLLKDPRFVERYTLLKKIRTDIYGSRGLLVFENKQFEIGAANR